MSRYLRMVMLVLAGLVFMLPLVSRPLFATVRAHGLRGVHSNTRTHAHQPVQHDGDPFSPCAE